MPRLINVSIRRNLLYVVNLILFYYVRKIDLIIITTKYKFNDSLIFTFLMLLGEFLGGLCAHLYQNVFLKKEKKESIKYFKIEFIQTKNKLKRPDNIIKIVILIFFTAFFDFVEFAIATFYIPKFPVVSPTAEYRFGGVIIIIGALLYHFNLRIKLVRHQLFSLIIMAVSLIIIITLEIVYRASGVSFGEFFFGHIMVIGYLIFVAFTDIIEKYLLEFNFLSPFKTLMGEAIFGFIIITIYSIGESPFKDLKRIYEEHTGGEFVLLLFLLFLYIVLSAGTNLYKIITNGLYSPMTKTLALYIFNPFLFIYYFFTQNDFLSEGERNYLYFSINIVVAVIISFFGCVFNEFLVLSCFGLDKDTHYSVSKRAAEIEMISDLMLLNDHDSFSVINTEH